MPEHLAPGVFVEEVSVRTRSIVGVPTSTAGFVGAARFGPVPCAGGPLTSGPRLVTGFPEFERVYGRLDDLEIHGGRTCFLAHAVRAFFLNGGRRLYVQRAFRPTTSAGVAAAPFAVTVGGEVTFGAWRARWPGALGNAQVSVAVERGGDVTAVVDGVVQATGARQGSLLEVWPAGEPPVSAAALGPERLRVVHVDASGVQSFRDVTGADVAPGATDRLVVVELRVTVRSDGRADESAGLSTHPSSARYVGAVLDRDEPEDEDAVVWLDYPMPDDPVLADEAAIRLAVVLATTDLHLTGGHDGAALTSIEVAGREPDPGRLGGGATGLAALAQLDEIAVVAVPDAAAIEDDADRDLATDALLAHAQRCRYRVAVVDGPRQATVSEIRQFRGRLDSSYAALYHPWVEVPDPPEPVRRGTAGTRLLVPPSGFVAGTYARGDIDRGVHKAPAGEVVLGVTGLAADIGRAQQEVLNAEGINVLRSFPGRDTRVWGRAR